MQTESETRGFRQGAERDYWPGCVLPGGVSLESLVAQTRCSTIVHAKTAVIRGGTEEMLR